MNVTEIVVKNDYCIGCGVCAGVCPSNNLNMDWSDKGELIPKSRDTCKDKCSICLDVCPFYDHKINQDDLANSLFSKIPKVKFNEYTGYYLNCYVGFQKDEKKRLNSASGGLATLFLSSLLEENIVDKVIGVGSFGNKDRMFDFEILNSSDEVYSCAGSAYYPVEISRVLKKILQEKDEINYAIIALPCVVYALRLAMEKTPKLKKRIKIIASFTCGQLQNRFCTEFLALKSGITIDNLSMMDFRRKSEKYIASNFYQVAIGKNGNQGIPQNNKELPYHLWYYQYFKQNACNFCDDIFGELADVTFMDAWLPKYIKDYRGTSLIISRTHLTSNLLENFSECILNEIPVTKIIESQSGVIRKKRVLIKGRLYEIKSRGSFCPEKRVNPSHDIYSKNKEFIELTIKTQNLSKELWPKYRLNNSVNAFWENFSEIESKIKKYKWKQRFIYLVKLTKHMFKKISREKI